MRSLVPETKPSGSKRAYSPTASMSAPCTETTIEETRAIITAEVMTIDIAGYKNDALKNQRKIILGTEEGLTAGNASDLHLTS